MDDGNDQTGAKTLVVDDEVELEADSESQLNLHKNLVDRAKVAKREVRVREFEPHRRYTDVAIPSGRDFRWVSASGARLESLLAIQFESYVFLPGFEAICDYNQGILEAAVKGVPLPGPGSVFRRLGWAMNEEPEELTLNPQDGSTGAPTIILGPPSDALLALASYPRWSFKMQNIQVRGHEEATALLIKYSNSLFFQIDLLAGATFALERERVRRIRPIRSNRSYTDINYPSAEYDADPMSLFWYARSARDMPLLQFLAFYQCIEFFFPTYARSEARRNIGRILKDPSFRTDRESDIARLLSAITSGRVGGFGDERSQLRAAVNECVTSDELRAFFTDDLDREQFYLGKKGKNKFHKVPLQNLTADLREYVVDRIYSIRCKIVHTKDTVEESRMILPFSDEANYLAYDIDLVQFLAKQVLVASSSPILS